jgi:hypothetical protein
MAMNGKSNDRSMLAAGVVIGLLGTIPAGTAFADRFSYELRAQHSDKCLDVSNASVDDGANVQQWTCAGVPQQHWDIVYAGQWGGQNVLRSACQP